MKYILIAFAFISCQGIIPKAKELSIANEVLDTIQSVPAKVVATPMIFETAFIKGTKEKGKNSTIELYGITIGNLKVTSGRIIACDPLHVEEYGIPYTYVFPIGEFPVQLAIAKVEDVEMTAFSRIFFSEEPVVKWEMALQQGQAPLPLGGEKIHGYGVDGGMGVLMDEDASKVIDKDGLMNDDAPLYTEMDKHYHDTWKYAMYNVGQYNVAAFTTGFGDGRYASYIGFDANGKPCRLLTDFGLFVWRNK